MFGAHGVVHLSALFNEVDACQIPVRVLILQAGVSSCACACVRQRIGCMQKLAVARTSVHQHTTTRYARRTRAHSHARTRTRTRTCKQSRTLAHTPAQETTEGCPYPYIECVLLL